MLDIYWPDELVPYAMTFWLRPHNGGSRSPFSQTGKVYELSQSMWVARLSFRGGYDGQEGIERFGPALDALLARLKGRVNRAGFCDFRRDAMRGIDTSGVGNDAAAMGDTSMTLTGLAPGAVVLAGDYLGGDGRPHIITADSEVDSGGEALVTFEPALFAAIGVDDVEVGNPRGWFRLVNPDDAGSNPVSVGQAVTYDLEFEEDIWAGAPAEPDQFLQINGIDVEIGEQPVDMS